MPKCIGFGPRTTRPKRVDFDWARAPWAFAVPGGTALTTVKLEAMRGANLRHVGPPCLKYVQIQSKKGVCGYLTVFQTWGLKLPEFAPRVSSSFTVVSAVPPGTSQGA